MPALDLRPLSLGELLDRTFSVYRRNFLLLLGIAALPYSILIAVVILFGFMARFAGTAAPMPGNRLPPSASTIAAIGSGFFTFGIVFLAVFLISLGGLVIAVSEIYFGRPVRIQNVLRRGMSRLWSLLAVMFLGMLIVGAGMILLIVPGIYLACRLSVALPTALIDKVGPIESIQRSFGLTKGFAWRAFMIVFLTLAISGAVVGLFQVPFLVLAAASVKNPQLVILWMILMQIGSFCGNILVAPVATIGFVLFYYDLRVRKEALDLQMMMQAIDPSPAPPPVTGGVPSMFGRDAS